MLYFREEVYPYVNQALVVDELLFAGKSQHQEIVLFRNSFLGHVLVLDGIIQLTEKDEFIYSEMMAHVPLFAHPNPRNLLIIGGGDGCVLEEVLKHRTLDRVSLVDIDGDVLELCRKHFVAGNRGAFDDARVNVMITDGIRYVRETSDRFDLILVDGPDPIEPDAAGAPLYSSEFYRLCADRLAPDGIFLIQSDVPFHCPDALNVTHLALQRVFRNVQTYTAPVPSYLGGVMCFVAANDGKDLSVPLRAHGPAGIKGLGYYTPEIHTASFQLPPYVASLTVPRQVVKS